MNVMHSIDLLYAISGFAVGALVGMTGVGGGALMTPLLILLFGVHPATAVGSDLLYAAATKTGGTLVHGLSRTVDWRIVGRLAAGSVPMTGLTLLMLSRFDVDGTAARGLITSALSTALFVTAAVLIFRRRIGGSPDCPAHRSHRRRAWRARLHLVRRCRRPRHDRARAPLPAASHGAHRWLRYRPCRAAHAGRRLRALVPWFDRLAPRGFIAVRFASRHRPRQLCLCPRTGDGLAPDARDDSDHRRQQIGDVAGAHHRPHPPPR